MPVVVTDGPPSNNTNSTGSIDNGNNAATTSSWLSTATNLVRSVVSGIARGGIAFWNHLEVVSRTYCIESIVLGMTAFSTIVGLSICGLVAQQYRLQHPASSKEQMMIMNATSASINHPWVFLTFWITVGTGLGLAVTMMTELYLVVQFQMQGRDPTLVYRAWNAPRPQWQSLLSMLTPGVAGGTSSSLGHLWYVKHPRCHYRRFITSFSDAAFPAIAHALRQTRTIQEVRVEVQSIHIAASSEPKPFVMPTEYGFRQFIKELPTFKTIQHLELYWMRDDDGAAYATDGLGQAIVANGNIRSLSLKYWTWMSSSSIKTTTNVSPTMSMDYFRPIAPAFQQLVVLELSPSSTSAKHHDPRNYDSNEQEAICILSCFADALPKNAMSRIHADDDTGKYYGVPALQELRLNFLTTPKTTELLEHIILRLPHLRLLHENIWGLFHWHAIFHKTLVTLHPSLCELEVNGVNQKSPFSLLTPSEQEEVKFHVRLNAKGIKRIILNDDDGGTAGSSTPLALIPHALSDLLRWKERTLEGDCKTHHVRKKPEWSAAFHLLRQRPDLFSTTTYD